MRPLIGVLPLFDRESHNLWINPKYLAGLRTAGGAPALLDLTDDEDYCRTMLQRCDGFLFTGGPDVEPSLYGHELIPECGFILPLRDSQELLLLKLALAADKPILGICRGVQILNVAAGGTMYQDIPAQKPVHLFHNQAGTVEFTTPTHPVTVVPGTKTFALLGRELLAVNSMHHQAVWDLAPGFIPSAFAPDGLVEAIESTSHRFAVGVQWHPEFLWENDPRQHRLFAGLVEACG